MTIIIGHKHFLDNIEPLPGETVVWEGGASKAGIIIQILWLIAAIMIIAGTFSFLIATPELFYKKNPDYVERPKADNDAGVTESKAGTEQKSVPESIDSDAQQNISGNDDEMQYPYIVDMEVVYQMLSVLIPIILLLIIAPAWLRIRHYWFVVTTERICIQSGVFTRKLATLDIDKVVSVVSTHTIIDRLFKVHSVEVIHAGVNAMGPNNGLVFFNPYKMSYVPVSTNLVGQLLNNWLPRDNRKGS